MIATSTALKPASRKPGQTSREGYLSRYAAPAKRKRESSAQFYDRLQRALKALQRIEAQLPRDTWEQFIAAYSQHWLYSVNHGETATAPAAFYNEWAEAQAKGAIPIDTEHPGHDGRRYHVYVSPRETARRVLGFED